MAKSEKVAMGIMRYVVPSILAVEFVSVAAFAWWMGGWQWAVTAVAVVLIMLLFSYAFCCSAAIADGCDSDEGGE